MPIDLPFSPEGATGVGIALPLLWWIWRELRKARSEDKRDDAESKLRADLMEINSSLHDQLQGAMKRADSFAEERNREREKRVRAEAEAASLRTHIDEVAARCQTGRTCGLRPGKAGG